MFDTRAQRGPAVVGSGELSTGDISPSHVLPKPNFREDWTLEMVDKILI
jgi:hypothetical protein